MGKFKTPTLYNSASLLFYMHDGAFTTLQQVVDHYTAAAIPATKTRTRPFSPSSLPRKNGRT